MQHWAEQCIYYHIMIDRFATGKSRFDIVRGKEYNHSLQDWMGGNLEGIINSLGYLQDLGINALLLTPFFAGKKYHGYWTTDFEQVDPHFGDRHQLIQLIHCAHHHNISVIMDLPITHCHHEAAIARQSSSSQNSANRDWFCTDDDGNYQGFFGDCSLPELNLDHPELRKYLKITIDRWLELGFDGIRFDHAKRPSLSFWQDFTSHLRTNHPQVFLLGENWHDSGEVGSLSRFLHGELNIPLSEALRQFIKRPTKTSIEAILTQVHNQQSLRRKGYSLPSFLDNHDMERVAQIADGNKSILALGYLIQFTLPYPPIVYYGSERAQEQSSVLAPGSYERDRHFREPMDWQNGQGMLQWVKRLTFMRKHYLRWLNQGDFQLDHLDDSTFSYSYTYNDCRFAIYNNYTPQPKRMSLPSGLFTLVTDQNCSCHIDKQKQCLQLDAYSGAVVKLNYTPKPMMRNR